jgi:DNA-binding NtrC family response regulator
MAQVSDKPARVHATWFRRVRPPQPLPEWPTRQPKVAAAGIHASESQYRRLGGRTRASTCQPIALHAIGAFIPAMATILHVDDEPSVGLLLEHTLSRAGHRSLGAGNVLEALQILSREHVDLIISDWQMPGLTGLELLALLRRESYDVPLVMLTDDASMEHAAAAIKAGAIDYITKPVKPQQIELAVDHALEFVRLRRENETLRQELMKSRNERQAPARNAAFMGGAVGSIGVGGASAPALPPEAVVLTSLNIDEAERALIMRALEVTKGNRTRTAELLGISVRTLRNKLNGPGRIEVA